MKFASRFAAVAFAAATALQASAGTYAVSPVTVQLGPGRLVGEVKVENRGSAPITIEARMFSWTQPAGVDHLEPARDAIAFPPSFTIAPGDSQTVRVGLRAAPASPVEQAWRLRLDELPGDTTPGAVALTVRQILPVFFRASDAQPQIAAAWRDGAVALENTGRRHVRVLAVTLADAAGATLGETTESFYLLAGASRSVSFPAGAAAAQRVLLKTPQGVMPVSLR